MKRIVLILCLFFASAIMYGESAYNLVSAFIKSNKHTKKMLAEKIIKTSPNSYYAYFCRGWIWQNKDAVDILKSKNLERAVYHYTKSISMTRDAP